MTTHPIVIAPKLAFSHSSLKDFDNCPLAFYHKRVAKDVAFVQTEAARWGEEVHKHFENRVKLRTPLPHTLSAFEPTLALFDGKESEVELKMAINDKMQPTEWMADDVWIRGIADVMVRLSKPKVWIGDYKTGKRRPDFGQLKLFSLLVWQHHPEVEECTTSYIWTQDKRMDTEVFHRKDANKMWEEVISKIRRVYKSNDSGNWPAKPSGLCGWCDVKKQLGCVYAR